MIVLFKILQVILALSILVLIHEFGHFIFAKMFKIKVEKFYLFFDAGGFALFRFKPKNSDTEYGIGWLPLGGYCKIAGMIDESMDTESLKSEPRPWEFRSKPAWQRLLVMAGGVLFNFILAILIYIGILAGWGETYVTNQGNKIYVNELAYEMGFRNGDEILSFDGNAPERFNMLQAELVRNKVSKATVLRDGDTVNIYIDHNMIPEVLNSAGMFSLAVPFVIDSIPETSVNYGSELKRWDKVIAIDGQQVRFVQDSRPILEGRKGQSVEVMIERADYPLMMTDDSPRDTLVQTLQVDTLGRLGVYTDLPLMKIKEYNILEAIPAGIKLTFSTIGGYIQDLKLVFTPSTEAYKSVGSFISMGQIFPSAWDWYSFLNVLALLSVILGVMNLLPIPALDGGHIVFTLYEMLTGRKPSDRFLMVAQVIGMILLFGLMILAFGNDIGRLIR